ncbi:YfhH family protein [Peribacillus sp. SCS-155]|uniref:YfhH family protein n=1 Tax=Peribacillus sedimenti TaxID=3115297 RepID=UPI003905A3BA
MTEKRYSTLTQHELQQEIADLMEKARKAEQMGMVNEFAVLERKAVMARAYLLNPEDFKPGIYHIKGAPGTHFKVEYLKGVFAWGYRLNGDGKEEALPISMLSESLEKATENL